jgi:hypothetical protein
MRNACTKEQGDLRVKFFIGGVFKENNAGILKQWRAEKSRQLLGMPFSFIQYTFIIEIQYILSCVHIHHFNMYMFNKIIFRQG